MSTSPRFEIEEAPRDEPAKRRGCAAGCFKGCLIATVVLLVLGGIAGWYLYNHWRELFSSVGAQVLKQAVDDSDLPQQEKVEIGVQVDQLAVEFREGRITNDEMVAIAQSFAKSPLMTSLSASLIERQYVDRSGLTDEEKAEARTTLRRYLRGTIDGKIKGEGTDAVMVHVADRQSDGNWKVREKVTDQELRDFLKEAKAQSDKAEVPVEADAIDASEEFKRIIQEATGQPQAPRDPDLKAEPPAEPGPA